MKVSISRVLASTALVAVGFAAAQFVPSEGTAQPAAEKTLASGMVRIEDAVPTRGEWGEWRRYFRGDTHGTKDMVVLAVTLKPGQAPHPPHRHAEEEIMILAEGSGAWHLDGKELQARKGDVLYAAPWTMHGLKNTGETPLTYYMVKWSGKGAAAPEKPAAPGPEAQPRKPRDEEAEVARTEVRGQRCFPSSALNRFHGQVEAIDARPLAQRLDSQRREVRCIPSSDDDGVAKGW